MKIPAPQIQSTLLKLFLKHQFRKEKAELLAQVFTESTVYGVSSHGVNRVPLFIEYVEKGLVKKEKEAELVDTFGNIERWDGQRGPGIVNATKCTARAIELAKEHGMGMVALRNTNHWMRGGTYGRQAADAGCISIIFTNTLPNMPAWGAKDSRLGNNPLVVSIPRAEGAIVLDMAMSQFAYGKMDNYRMKGKKLPYPGGWNDDDELSDDPEKILANDRVLPMGYWKGSALALVLDMLATLLSAGNSTYRIGLEKGDTGISQVYLCIDPTCFNDKELQEKLINEIISYTHNSTPMEAGGKTFFPGERSTLTRVKNLQEGVPVEEEIWQKIIELTA